MKTKDKRSHSSTGLKIHRFPGFHLDKKTLVIGLFIVLSCFCYKQIQQRHYEKTDGFSLSNISSSLSFNPNWVAPSLSLDEQRQLASALSQPYTYLGTGGQCYAFVSEDKQYVIKFFKHNIRRPPFYANLPMPGSLKKKIEQKTEVKRAKLERDFTSYKIAMEELKDDTGMIFLHLNKTKNLRQSLKITDKADRTFTVDLDDKEFLVQKKAEQIYPQIKAFMEKGEQEKAQRLISSILSLIVHGSEKGIFDEDARTYRNFGCIGEKAIVIDTGRFSRKPFIQDPKNYIKDIHGISAQFLEWLEKNYPELKSYFEEEIHALETRYN